MVQLILAALLVHPHLAVPLMAPVSPAAPVHLEAHPMALSLLAGLVDLVILYHLAVLDHPVRLVVLPMVPELLAVPRGLEVHLMAQLVLVDPVVPQTARLLLVDLVDRLHLADQFLAVLANPASLVGQCHLEHLADLVGPQMAQLLPAAPVSLAVLPMVQLILAALLVHPHLAVLLMVQLILVDLVDRLHLGGQYHLEHRENPVVLEDQCHLAAHRPHQIQLLLRHPVVLVRQESMT